ncbi:type II toxin-antitoxin system VapC family toxin [Acinetobacter populi]|jgi:predicted nucleic acid-binding protein|uniref:PIN domain nuclease n=1 Tax=Acinetobacter populi TaxID=1582270 RepID=A0A1Z9YUU5_9GAMM|nr:PIN domain-containing protein [Acinetobacter populi]MCH4248337.1 PIN domain-containing protein [Acinetobacter populi]OUY05953.1 PIN domain nuclease [Acinetobacter populi]
MILVDTSIWSLAFRKKQKTNTDMHIITELSELILNGKVVVIGAIRQEILSGIRDELQFQKLKNKLSIFKDIDVITQDYECAAQFYNQCRRHGIQGSHIDFLICAIAVRQRLEVFTLDQDFKHYQSYIGDSLSIYEPKS